MAVPCVPCYRSFPTPYFVVPSYRLLPTPSQRETHFRANREEHDGCLGVSPERQGQKLVWTVSYVPHLLDSGLPRVQIACSSEDCGMGLLRGFSDGGTMCAILQVATLETTQRQIDGVFSQLLFKCHLREVAFVGA